ncbi:Predicted exporter protein, RND superfamily [Evansella caseinilytica]|uniref:Predicted exporter protein, RND superfamily n=1 Tax=Evansella caseinilytica TaxID=1503961 RepID=A0A1H3GLX4_9BACI|nr:MMPL family transporter [Evansella caseinilytica]SDY04070.1 Predicted exporter protein, RND superfamily [Evansella caseinilytica]
MRKFTNRLIKNYRVILLLSAIVFLLAAAGASRLTVSSDMEEMLPGDSKTLRAIKEFDHYFQSQESGIVVVKGEAEKSKAFLLQLEQQFIDNNVEADILYNVDLSEFQPFQPLFLDTSIYEELEAAVAAEDIEKASALLTSLTENQGKQDDSKQLQYIANEEENVFLMMIRMRSDKNNDFLENRENFYDGVKDAIDSLLNKEVFRGMDAGLTGGAFIQDIEADRAAFDGFFSTMLITILLIIVLAVAAFRKVLLLTSVVYPLLLGALLTAAFAYFMYGSINMFSMSFALLLIGLGIDFSIHFISRYLEERKTGETAPASVKTALKGTGVSIIIGALTTSAAFFSFVLAKFKAFEQMGIISAIGIIVLCVTMVLIVPALIMLIDAKKPTGSGKKARFSALHSIGKGIERRPVAFIICIFLLVPILFFQVKNTEIIGEMDKLYPDNIDSKQWETVVKEEFDYSPNTLTFMVENEEVLAMAVEELEKRDDVETILSVHEYLPENQDYKLEVIEQLNDFLAESGAPDTELWNIEKMHLDDLPENIKANYVGKENRLMVEVVPSVNIYDQDNYNSLESAIITTSGNAPVSMAAIMNEVIGMVKDDIVLISGLCIAVAAAFLFLVFRSVKEMLLCITPVALTLYITLGVLPLLHIEINVLSIAAFPLIIGIGIDSSIHLLHRLKSDNEKSVRYVLMTTGRAVVLTALTTCIGFGSLIFINHPGMANLGAVVTVGLLICLAMTLTLLPALYVKLYKKSGSASQPAADSQPDV